ncbi:MAG TPA: acyl-CoA thioesterase [Smithellaceae bacterium]|nr:acyl-CoA thioesterase [Smithellaceae bacterium]
MKLKTYSTIHMVKGDDLNHHGTLFAGKTAMWFVESGFIAAAGYAPPKNIVCLNIHGMLFAKPIFIGTIIRFESKVVLAGKTSLVSYIKVVDNNSEDFLVDGFITFVHIDENSRRIPHGIVINPTDPEDIALMEKAKSLLPEK